VTRIHAQPLDLTGASDALVERFWSKVDKRSDDECWEWTQHRKSSGYGQFVLRKGVFLTASRVALALTIGRPLRQGELACHRCDNPPCCNPAHIFAGTAYDNATDAINKGRANRSHGEKHKSARLTEDIVREIRQLEPVYGLDARLAVEFGISANSIRKVRQGKSWRHVA
jgi:hypothetical protein